MFKKSTSEGDSTVIVRLVEHYFRPTGRPLLNAFFRQGYRRSRGWISGRSRASRLTSASLDTPIPFQLAGIVFFRNGQWLLNRLLVTSNFLPINLHPWESNQNISVIQYHFRPPNMELLSDALHWDLSWNPLLKHYSSQKESRGWVKLEGATYDDQVGLDRSSSAR